MPVNPKIPQGPIPGENYTSDTKNYPWHRPPDIDDMDDAIEASIKQLTTREGSYALLTMLQSGVNVVQATDIFVTSGIAEGKWTPDFALLLAGPVAHMIKIMADGYGVKYDMGTDDIPLPTISFVKAKAEIDPNRAVEVADNTADLVEAFKSEADKQMAQESEQFGLMGAPSEAANNIPAANANASGFMAGPKTPANSAPMASQEPQPEQPQ